MNAEQDSQFNPYAAPQATSIAEVPDEREVQIFYAERPSMMTVWMTLTIIG